MLRSAEQRERDRQTDFIEQHSRKRKAKKKKSSAPKEIDITYKATF
jgi:hypothetical protein